MKLSNKRISVYLVIIAIAIFFITSKIIKGNKTTAVLPDAGPEIIKSEENKILAPVVKSTLKRQFVSNAEIKKEYGKLETVTLWNGKTYTGAVINTDKVYSIITLDGLIKIPMKEVKIREILK